MAHLKIQSLADLEAEMRAVARGERAAPLDAVTSSVESAELARRLFSPENQDLPPAADDTRPRSKRRSPGHEAQP